MQIVTSSEIILPNASSSEPDTDLVSKDGLSLPPLQRLSFEAKEGERLTHYLFRYPAKFHPPVIRSLIARYTQPSERILDPFCGSGSLLVEAAVMGRHAVGTDIDPLAAFISRVKAHRFSSTHLTPSCDKALAIVRPSRRASSEYVERMFRDLTIEEYGQAIAHDNLWVPAIPNLFHWFRRYVVIDLARIHRGIEEADIPHLHRAFLRLCFASIIRRASNADPVPVSGLEVTTYMKRKDAAGRLIDPYKLFEAAVTSGLAAVEQFRARAYPDAKISAFQCDATQVASRIHAPVECVITSPPYHNAVDYYRRHQLEMFWLGMVATQRDRLALLPKYIGQPKIPVRHPLLREADLTSPVYRIWRSRMEETSQERAQTFKHYALSMRNSFAQLARLIPVGRDAILVVGHSTWQGDKIPTDDLFAELAGDSFRLVERLWYPVVNRYMSYERHNGASIDEEYVLVFERTAYRQPG